MQTRLFIPAEALEAWLRRGLAEFSDGVLTVGASAARFGLVEAVRVLREVTGRDDEHDMVGKVRSAAFLAELGAEVVQRSMLIEERAYEIVPGFVAVPRGIGEHAPTARVLSTLPPNTPARDEDLLAELVMKTLE